MSDNVRERTEMLLLGSVFGTTVTNCGYGTNETGMESLKCEECIWDKQGLSYADPAKKVKDMKSRGSPRIAADMLKKTSYTTNQTTSTSCPVIPNPALLALSPYIIAICQP